MEKLLFCLGVTKGGTTWLHSALTKHPGVNRIPRKEIHYFLRQYGGVDRLTDSARLGAFALHCRRASFTPLDRELGRSLVTDPNEYGSPWDVDMAKDWQQDGYSMKRFRGFVMSMEWYKRFLRGPINDAWYQSLFESVPAGKWGLDFSTTNFLANSDGYKSMATAAPEARAILLLRDPIDRLWSHMKFHADVTRDILRFHVWGRQALRDFADHHQLMTSSLYGDAVENTLASFGPEKSLILNFEDIRTRPQPLFDDVQRFADLKPIELPKRAPGDDRVINKSADIPLPKGLFSHIAGEFERDLERVAKAGITFVEPWIAHAQAHQQEKSQPEFWGLRPLTRRALNYVADDRMRRRALQENR